MRFQFRLQTLQRLRQRERDEAGGKVGEAHAAIVKLDEQVENLQRERRQLANEGTEGRIGSVTVDRLLTKGRYDLQLQAEIRSLRDTRAQIELELQKRQQILKDAEVELKKLEKLKEIQFAQFQQSILRHEQNEIDEINHRRSANLRGYHRHD